MKMADLAQEIFEMNIEIEGYVADLKNATSPEQKKLYLEAITASRDVLAELLKQQAELNKCNQSINQSHMLCIY